MQLHPIIYMQEQRDVYSITGEKELFDAISRIWEDLTSKKMYITGGYVQSFMAIQSMEIQYQKHMVQRYELPNKIAYNESCANIAKQPMFCMRMLTLTGDAKYGDVAEQIMYNAGISGTNLELKRYFYSNPLTYRVNSQIPFVSQKEICTSILRMHIRQLEDGKHLTVGAVLLSYSVQ